MPLIVVVLLFVAEVTAVVALGSAIGVAPTVALVVGTSVLGVLLLRNQGRRTLAALRAAQTTHRSPGRELADGALGGVGALLMVLPGLITDVLGLLLVLPPTRALVRPLLGAAIARKVLVVPVRRTYRPGEVLEGEVVSTDEHTAARRGHTPLERPVRH